MVIIAILAAIAIVSYNGITRRAVETSMKSDLRSVSTILELDKINLGAYPSSAADADGRKGLVSSGDNVVEYFTMDNGGYCISVSSPRTENVFYFSTATNMIQEGGMSYGRLDDSGR